MPVLQVPLEVSMVMIKFAYSSRWLSHPAALLALCGNGVEGGTFLLELFGDRLEI